MDDVFVRSAIPENFVLHLTSTTDSHVLENTAVAQADT